MEQLTPIVIVYKDDYPWDVRVEKIALTLSNRGHKVTIVAKNSRQEPTIDSAGPVSLRRLPRISFLPSVVRNLLYYPIWFSPLWVLTLRSVIRENQRAIIIVRDLPLARAASMLTRSKNAQVVLDMAEAYPCMYRSAAQFAESLGEKLTSLTVKNPKLALAYEKSVLRRVDHTMAVVEESRDRLIELGVPADRVSVVSNTPATDRYKGKTAEQTGTVLRLVYVGFLTKIRGLDLLVESVSEFVKLENSSEGIVVDIVGKGSMTRRLQNLVRELDLTDIVSVHGWLPHSTVDTLLSKANVGVLTYRVCDHWNHTIPNKIFDYMLNGLPVVATPVRPIARIIDATNCGLIADSESKEDIARALRAMKDPKLRETLAQNGHDAVLKKYNWTSESQTLFNIVDNASRTMT